ncbi:hypothetical protein LUZ60_009508 [Juncus effusus]|nr:hypothetical protein LUZ60_009508 [Juncus effusus]
MTMNLNSHFLPKNFFPSHPLQLKQATLTPFAKLSISEIFGGRGLCNGEKGLQKELTNPKPAVPKMDTEPGSETDSGLSFQLDPNGFEKELMGFTGGFPGGETGLKSFIEKNPPPVKKEKEENTSEELVVSKKKPSVPDLPLFLPGMIVLVKNPRNPFHMYCGIVQRVTDGKAGVLFEGGNWDKLITFRLDELERREKGPPMVNPKSVILESLVEKLG